MPYCTECGSLMPDDEQFCRQCGTKLRTWVTKPAPGQEPEPVPGQEPWQEPVPRQEPEPAPGAMTAPASAPEPALEPLSAPEPVPEPAPEPDFQEYASERRAATSDEMPDWDAPSDTSSDGRRSSNIILLVVALICLAILIALGCSTMGAHR